MGWLADLFKKRPAVFGCKHDMRTHKVYNLQRGGDELEPVHALKLCSKCGHRDVEQIASDHIYKICMRDYFFWYSRRLWLESGEVHRNTRPASQPTETLPDKPVENIGGGKKDSTPMRKRKLTIDG